MASTDAHTLREEITSRMKNDFIPAFNDNMQHHMLFSADAAILPMNHEPKFTRTNIKSMLEITNEVIRPRIQEMDLVEVLPLDETTCSTVLRLKVKLKNGKEQWSKSLTIWKKIDGQWFLFRDMYSPCE